MLNEKRQFSTRFILFMVESEKLSLRAWTSSRRQSESFSLDSTI